MIVERKKEKAKFWYKLDNRCNYFGYIEGLSDDINRDGYFDIIISKYWDDEYYIIS